MGGRGAASGLTEYKGRSGKIITYGSEYRTVYHVSRIKFVTPRDKRDSVRTPQYTRSKRRVYVTVGKRNELKAITLYDKNGKVKLQIDLTHFHGNIKPHVHIGYNHGEGRGLKNGERMLVKLIERLWKEKDNG